MKFRFVGVAYSGIFIVVDRVFASNLIFVVFVFLLYIVFFGKFFKYIYFCMDFFVSLKCIFSVVKFFCVGVVVCVLFCLSVVVIVNVFCGVFDIVIVIVWLCFVCKIMCVVLVIVFCGVWFVLVCVWYWFDVCGGFEWCVVDVDGIVCEGVV